MWNEMPRAEDTHVEALLGKLGIVFDDTQEDRERFMALEELMAKFAMEAAKEVNPTPLLDDRSIDWWMETAEEYLVG